MKPVVLIAAMLGIALPAASARADDTSVVAVLPLNVSGKGLSLYGKPVADAIAKRLTRELGVSVETLPTSGSVPARVGLVVDGRIVAASKRRVVLEARVRDPRLGRAGAAVVTRTGALSAIDELAAQLAIKLAPHVKRALAAQKRRAARATRLAAKPKTTPRVPPNGGTGPASPTHAPKRTEDRRPIMVVFMPTGRAADVPIAPPMFRAARRIAALAGYRIVRSYLTGVQPGQPAAREIRRTGARYALMIHIVHVGFDWHGPILSARGKVRVVVVDPRGRRIYDRKAATGTLVGNRGDRHGALVHSLAEQTVDIAAPQIKRALAR